MPTEINKKIDFFSLKFWDGDTLIRPVLNADLVWLNETENKMAKSIGLDFDVNNAKTGSLIDLMHHFPNIEFKASNLQVLLPESRNKKRAAMDLPFRMFFTELPNKGFLGFEPVFGIASFGASHEDLEQNMQANIELEFARAKKSEDLAQIITTQWFKDVQITSQTIYLATYTINEIKNYNQDHNNKYLAAVAERMIHGMSSESWYFDQEMDNMHNALLGKFRRSVLVTGRSGIGKSALIKGFIHKNQKRTTNPGFYQTNASTLISRLMTDVVWQENLLHVCKELRDSENILYIENFADLFEVGQFEGSNQSIADYLKNYIQRGEIVIISECTAEELAAIEVRSPGYSSLFHIINLQEQAPEKLSDIILKSIKQTAQRKNVSVTNDAIEEALRLQKRFMPYSGFPGKSIRFLEAIIIELRKKTKLIGKEEILQAFCQETGMPGMLIDQNIELKLDELEAHFSENIHGQEVAVKTVSNVIATFKAFLARGEKPIATLLFIGPTGVGKTEMAKVLAEYVFGSRNKFIRFDMSEFSDPYSVLRLTGQGESKQGLLTDAVRRDPFSVVLFDELEKAHFTFYDLLLQILGEGRLSDARGEVVDFCSTIVVMTSNIGVTNFGRGDLGFRKSEESEQAAVKHFEKEVQKYFRPELFNRLDQIVTFLPLNKQTIRQIVDREINGIRKREGLFYRNIELILDEAVLDHLGTNGYNPKYGARFLQRTIRKQLLIPLAKLMNELGTDKPFEIRASIEDEEIQFKIDKSKNSGLKSIDEQQEQELFSAANEITKLRRSLSALRESTQYINIISSLEVLKIRIANMKKKMKDRFYVDPLQEQRQLHLSKIMSECDDAHDKIFDLERRSVKAYMGMIQKLDKHDTFIQNWKNKLMALRRDIYDETYPGNRTIIIAIYGPSDHIESIFNFYLQLIEHQKYKSEITTVWIYKKSYSYQVGKETKARQDKMGVLYGFEIEVSGPGANLYFAKEKGVQTITDPYEMDFKYIVFIQRGVLKNYKTPDNINRKAFFDQMKSRRNFSKSLCEDITYKIKTKDLSQFNDRLMNHLNKEFYTNLETILTSEDEEN